MVGAHAVYNNNSFLLLLEQLISKYIQTAARLYKGYHLVLWHCQAAGQAVQPMALYMGSGSAQGLRSRDNHYACRACCWLHTWFVSTVFLVTLGYTVVTSTEPVGTLQSRGVLLLLLSGSC